YTIVDQTLTKAFGDILGTLLPIILMAALFFFIFRAQTKGAQDIFSFGRSKAKLFAKGKQDVTFADVAGVDDAKKELEEIVDFLKNPAKYRKIGARTPKGVLLFGPAGVGKTLLARACAGQAGVPFFSIAGSEFMEMLVGVGASVTGDTPILIKKDEKVELSPIGEFIDQFYNSDKEGILKVNGLKTLGLKPEINGFWGSRSSKRPVFGGSRWQNVESVYRHKVKEIYEIKFLGGRLRTTGDHSVFIREHGGIREKETRTLKTGDVLVNLPAKTRAWNPRLRKNDHFIKKHEFSEKISETFLDVWQDDPKELKKYDYVLAMQGTLSQYAIAGQTGVSQATIGNWQGGIHEPQLLSKKLVKLNLPNKVKVTPSLMRLFGYYTAEGRGQGNLNFTFNIAEKDFVQDVTELMETVFGLSNPKLEITDTNTVRVIYYSAHLGRFFANHCGLGSHNKHLPSFIWDLPFKYFVEFLRGYWRGDGYETKSGKLSMTSVSHRLIRELAWLCSMHGIKVGIKHEILKLGRSNLNGKPFPEGECWSLIIGKTSNPFKKKKHPYQFKRAIVKSVERKKFDGYVYDLCGVEKEAFFGGETPILLHNSRARDLFAQAKTAAPSIIFIDEIDAIGRQRGRGLVGGHDEREQTLNQILVEMDGFTPNDNVIVIAATNRGDLLDPALLRPGRFDRRVVLDMPDKEGRLAILKIHARGKKFKQDIKWGKIADRTVGFSGADLENMLNEAAILAAREGKATIGEKEAEEAATKVKLGPAKRKLQSDEDRKITAYHEGGHAIVTHSLDKMDPVQRISIVARGMSLGHTLIPPAADRSHETKSRIIQQISAMLGGRAAEQVIFNEMTSGASNDIAQATRLARAMVIEWGMSPLGPINLGPDTGTGEFGQMEWYEGAKVSPGMQDRIDNEVKKIVDESYKGALEIVKRKRKVLDKIADALLQKETIGREEFEKIVGEKTGK
ncbi:ATP-dependent zinc metalloprotease FtsH, partial [Candidatus Woesebacteria bacterium]|nr:ATP-dependent zinc metalloprotease FtsH [Candidatus Woesebacteria bacterium]